MRGNNVYLNDNGGVYSDNDDDNDDGYDDNDDDDDDDCGYGSDNLGKEKRSKEILLQKPRNVDDEIAQYDNQYIQTHPDIRLQEVITSHQHLRQWSYFAPTLNSLPRTSVQKQRLEEQNRASVSARGTLVVSGPRRSRDSYMGSRQQGPQQEHNKHDEAWTTFEHSFHSAPTLLEMATTGYSDDDLHAERRSMESSPVKSGLHRMLHSQNSPALDGVVNSRRLSSFSHRSHSHSHSRSSGISSSRASRVISPAYQN